MTSTGPDDDSARRSREPIDHPGVAGDEADDAAGDLGAAERSSSTSIGRSESDEFGRPAVGPERSGVGAALAVLVLLVVVLGAGYVWAAVNAGDRLPPGTVVSGVLVGGSQPAAAEVTLRSGLATSVAQDVDLTVAGTEVTRSPNALGLTVDYTASIDKAVRTPAWLPSNLWHFYTGGDDFAAVVDVDRGTLLPLLDSLVADSEQAPVEGQVIISGTGYEVVEPVDGTTLDRDAAVETLQRSWLSGAVIELPLEPTSPEIGADAVGQAVEQIAEPAVSGPIRLVTRGADVRLDPADYTDLLSLTPDDGALALAVNQERLPLRVALALREEGALKAGRDASFEIVDGKPEIRPAVVGRTVDAGPLIDRFRQAVLATDPADRVVRVPLERSRPSLTTRAARDLGISERLAEVRIPYAEAVFRDTNLARAAEELDGAVIAPGGTLSFNDTVGAPTPDRGFVEGPLYDDGQAFTGAGAGLSRLATALTSAAWQAALDFDQRSAMPWHPEEYPIGVDAAVQFGSVDLVLANPSPYGVLVTAEADTDGDRSVTVELWSTSWRSVRTSLSAFTDQTSPVSEFVSPEGCVSVPGQPGFDVTATRVLERPADGRQVRTDELSTSYRPLPNIVCVSP